MLSKLRLLIHAITYTSPQRACTPQCARTRARVYEISNSISAWFRISKIITFKRGLFVYAPAISRIFRNFRRANLNLILASVAVHMERWYSFNVDPSYRERNFPDDTNA